MLFFSGMHQPNDASKVRAACVSVSRLQNRKSGFSARYWIVDSGAFSTIAKHGGYPEPVEVYAAQIRKFAGNGKLLAAVAQDYMCESVMLAKTGLTIADHQRLTIERYDALCACDTAGIRILPVLQGYAPADYVAHIRAYGDRLKPRMWVGVGSVCKRNANPAAIYAVLAAIKRERPDLRLHGFGLKITALAVKAIRDMLFSADSMAWSFAARRAGRNANCPKEARAYADRVSLLQYPELANKPVDLILDPAISKPISTISPKGQTAPMSALPITITISVNEHTPPHQLRAIQELLGFAVNPAAPAGNGAAAVTT
jgi:hypothetical protein